MPNETENAMVSVSSHGAYQQVQQQLHFFLSAALKVSKQATGVLEFLFCQCPHPGTTSPTLLHYLPDTALTSFCRALALSSAFSTALASTRIDAHLHILPPAFAAAIDAAGGDPTGCGTPDWTFEGMMSSMERTSTDIGIMSVSAPGVQIAGTGQAARDLARTLNEYLAMTATESAYADRLGFFGVFPDWRAINGTLTEIDFLYSTQRLCNDVMLMVRSQVHRWRPAPADHRLPARHYPDGGRLNHDQDAAQVPGP
ncbi:2-amino-3-carboxymuconate-6-semialdehyde decarboxylase [Fusarium agapanthi]|uniref:2-amino-3-carboxymuconate-6-semialdehyde decarboxylase n=1 Tax=Fusarium agapanthi TaxID=1803897 RepID=A0A9P5BA78_9HYPO|nr:2-amino-3-carboxymuconate-6-semialdehyde decarboxylase [Fusarium agapanthi]